MRELRPEGTHGHGRPRRCGQRFRGAAAPQLGERLGLPLDLDLQRLDVVGVDVRVAHHVHKLRRLEAAHVRNHDRQKGVRRDVERDAEPDVAGALQPTRRSEHHRHNRKRLARSGAAAARASGARACLGGTQT